MGQLVKFGAWITTRLALKAFRIVAGLDVMSPDDLAIGDVTPLVSGKRKPDGKIDASDVVAILRKAVGLSSW